MPSSLTIKPNTQSTITENALKANTIIVEEGAQLDLICIQVEDAVEPLQKRIILKTNAVARVFTGLFASVDVEIVGELEGDHTTYENHVMYFVHNTENARMVLNTEHKGKNTMSRTLVRGVATDSGQADFKGSINIHQTGAGADGFLQHEGLLLSKKARINSLPGLEIGTDDVKASHGSAVHYIQPEQLFYLQSRGIETPEAKRMIVAGFLEEMLATVRESAMLQEIHTVVADRQNSI